MRATSRRVVAYPSAEPLRPSHRWLQAGFSSFAYRLAHLAIARPLATAAAVLFFYFA
jgi:hypothetical protein